MSGEINPQFVAQVEKVRAALDHLDYFQLLRLPYDAIDAEIRNGYHEQARKFHPDRYHHLGVEALNKNLTAIAKRIAEAYTVLRDPYKRETYRENVQGEAREQSLRFEELDESEDRQESRARGATTRAGADAYELAVQAHDKNDTKGALRHLKMAMIYERDNQSFKDLFDEWSSE